MCRTPITTALLVLGWMCCLGTAGCGKQGQGKPDEPLPELGAGRVLEPGIRVHEVTLRQRATPIKVWVYLPDKAKAEAKLPCVLIAPAGSPLICGMHLSEEDRKEHLPYVRAGFAIVSYEIAGHVPETASDAQFVQGVKAFQTAEAGLVNARQAFDYALAKVTDIDPQRVYAAGHSSAGTLALLVAQHDERVKGCIAYAPCTNIVKRVGKGLAALEQSVAGVSKFIENSSPRTHVAKLRCPVFVFHADDDSNVPVSESEAFVAVLKKTNANVTFVRVPRGDHYDSMIREGIPRAIEWLKTLAKS